MDQVFEPAEDVLMSDSGEKKVLMSMDDGNFIELNATGRAVWERLDGKRSLGDISTELQALYKVDQSQCEPEILDFIGSLQAQNLITSKD